jgi:hypothetical protein
MAIIAALAGRREKDRRSFGNNLEIDLPERRVAHFARSSSPRRIILVPRFHSAEKRRLGRWLGLHRPSGPSREEHDRAGGS